MPELQIKDDQNMELVEEFKILGLIVSTDLKWNKHVTSICIRDMLGFGNLEDQIN